MTAYGRSEVTRFLLHIIGGNIMVGTEISKEQIEKVLRIIESAKATGKTKKGANEATKALERSSAKLVAIAGDISPAEIVMHLPLLGKEKNIPVVQVGSKEELGAAAGLPVGTAAVAIIEEGDAKNALEAFKKELSEQ